MGVTIKIPAPLQKLTQGRGELEVEAATLRELFNSIEEDNKGFKPVVVTENGEIQRYAAVYVNEQNVRYGQNLDTPLKSGDEVIIVPLAHGGR